MATDVLSVVWRLAMKVKEAHDGVQGNKEQCKLLNDHVQNVAKALKGLPSATMQKEEVIGALKKLVETLRSAADLIEGFKKQNWFTKIVKQSSMAEKFAELFRELDSTRQVCGFAVEVTQAQLKPPGRMARRFSSYWKGTLIHLLSLKRRAAGMPNSLPR